MSKIKKICFLLALIALAACKTANIPEQYNFRVKELQSNPFGCWMEATVNSFSEVPDLKNVSGELLAIQRDSAFLLTADGTVSRLAFASIASARLYTHKNQSGTYLLTSGILIIPSLIGAIAYPEYAGPFLILAIPTLITGIIHSLIESRKQKNVLIYPEKQGFTDFGKFARFPAGIPENIDLRLLSLRKSLPEN